MAAWVGALIGRQEWSKPIAFGVTIDGQLIGGVVYDNYRGHDVEMSCAGQPGWLDRWLIKRFFEYPFVHLGCCRVTALVRETNEHALDFDKRLGFKVEGFHEDGYAPGEGMYSLGMLKRNCRWFDGR